MDFYCYNFYSCLILKNIQKETMQIDNPRIQESSTNRSSPPFDAHFSKNHAKNTAHGAKRSRKHNLRLPVESLFFMLNNE